MSRNKEERKKNMMKILREKRMVSLSEISRLLGVSEMTTRRYAGELDDHFSLTGSHLVWLAEDTQTPPLRYKINEEAVRNLGKKKSIGQLAASMIETDDVIYIDAGTTTPFIAEQIPDDLKFTAVCCSLNVFLILNQKQNCTIILMGGEFHEGTQVFSSRSALDTIREIRITKAFISAAGIDKKLGLTCFNPYETDLKKEVIKYSQYVYVVADSTKIDTVKMAYFANIDQMDSLITDCNITEDQVQWIQDGGINLLQSDNPSICNKKIPSQPPLSD